MRARAIVLACTVWLIDCACAETHERDAGRTDSGIHRDAPDSALLCDRSVDPPFDRRCDDELNAYCGGRARALAGEGWVTFGRCLEPFGPVPRSECTSGPYCTTAAGGNIQCQCAPGLLCTPDQICVADAPGGAAHCIEMCSWLRDR